MIKVVRWNALRSDTAKNISSCKGQRTCSKRVQEQSLDDSLSAAALPLEVPFQVCLDPVDDKPDCSF
jgi:hypothetical protein